MQPSRLVNLLKESVSVVRRVQQITTEVSETVILAEQEIVIQTAEQARSASGIEFSETIMIDQQYVGFMYPPSELIKIGDVVKRDSGQELVIARIDYYPRPQKQRLLMEDRHQIVA